MTDWNDCSRLDPKSYKCAYCGKEVITEIGYFDTHRDNIYICPCGFPTHFDRYGHQYPDSAYGNKLANLPQTVSNLYDEARNCIAINSYTASVMCCRKLLMHIAVEKNAKENLKFVEYVDYLDAHHYIPPDGKDWVDYIRNKGNEANHEIVLMNREDAVNIIAFTEMLLKFVYEFPAKIAKIKKQNKGVKL